MADGAHRIDDLQARREYNAALADLRRDRGRELTTGELAEVRERHRLPAAPYRNIGAETKSLAEAIREAERSPLLAEQLATAQERSAAAEVAAREHEAAQRDQALRARLRAAGVPGDHEDVLVTRQFDHRKDALSRVQRWRKSNRRLLVLVGDVGLGKSLAACWLIATGPRRPYRHPGGYDERTWPEHLQPRYIRSSRLARLSMYEANKGKAKPERLELELVEKCSLLIIDEVGRGDVGSFERWADRLDDLVGGRYDAGLDTVMTTNKTREEFREIFGMALFDRLTGKGGTWEEFAGASMRGGVR